jgi:hypothetical protein
MLLRHPGLMGTVLLVVLTCSMPAAGQIPVFQSDFEETVLEGLSPNNYVFEENGTFAPFRELSITSEGGSIRISGRKETDTVVLEGHDVGWIGSALSLDRALDASGAVSLEVDVMLRSHSMETSGINGGFVLYLTLEFDRNNRIVFNLMESVGLGARFVQMHMEEDGNFLTCWGPTPHCLPHSFPDGESLRLRLEFDPATLIAKGLIDGTEVVSKTYGGATGDARISIGAALRGLGDTIDVSFDNLLVTQAGPPEASLRRGDANADGELDISDPVTILECLFLGGDCGSCPDAWDGNDDGVIHIGDPIYLLEWQFRVGTPPAAPFPACGPDPTVDGLGDCEAFPQCTDS